MATERVALYPQDRVEMIPAPGYVRENPPRIESYTGTLYPVVMLILLALCSVVVWKLVCCRRHFVTAGISVILIAVLEFLYYESLVPRRFFNSFDGGLSVVYQSFHAFFAPVTIALGVLLVAIGLIRLERRSAKSI